MWLRFKGGHYYAQPAFLAAPIRGRRLFGVRRLFKEIRYNKKNSPLHYNHAFYFPLNMRYSGCISIIIKCYVFLKLKNRNITILFLNMQWAFGVTCWEVFTCGRVPYTGIPALNLLAALRNGERLDPPNNTACSDEM